MSEVHGGDTAAGMQRSVEPHAVPQDIHEAVARMIRPTPIMTNACVCAQSSRMSVWKRSCGADLRTRRWRCWFLRSTFRRKRAHEVDQVPAHLFRLPAAIANHFSLAFGNDEKQFS